jgi:hypothetical protein
VPYHGIEENACCAMTMKKKKTQLTHEAAKEELMELELSFH